MNPLGVAVDFSNGNYRVFARGISLDPSLVLVPRFSLGWPWRVFGLFNSVPVSKEWG